MAPDPVDLILPSSLDRAAAIALLHERLELVDGRPRTSDRTLLDSFDGRLRAAGLRAERPAGRGAGLELHEAGAPVRRAGVPRAKRLLVTELPEGAVRERLAPVLEERALLPAVRVRSGVQPLAVVDGDRKTVVRLEIEHPQLIAAGGKAIALKPRLAVRPVLGYDRAYERTLATLRDELGLEPAKRPLYDEAVRKAGGRPGGIATKVKAELAARAPPPTPRPRSCSAACTRSRWRTSRARSTTSTRSSCTTCASRSAARAPSCASSRTCTTRRPARTCATS